MLLSYFIGQGKTVAELKKSQLQSLLLRPQVKKLLAGLSNGVVAPDNLHAFWPDSSGYADMRAEIQPFVLTLGRWGGESPRWQQTTRHGYNLVVQLNFSNAHDNEYRKLVKPDYGGYLNYYGHPVLLPGRREMFRETLAWARLDIDFDTDEVLIEEIQSDWVRRAKRLLNAALRAQARDSSNIYWRDLEGNTGDLIKYVKDVLMPYIKIWDEAMLAATLDFVKNELGIRRVYYHSYETGPALKFVEGNSPRDLYTRLPKRFCFEKTQEHPAFLQSDRRFRKMIRKIATPLWYRLDIEEVKSNAYVS